ncbi:hypothetical protein PG988_007265 [Apiospora saccharicola]
MTTPAEPPRSNFSKTLNDSGADTGLGEGLKIGLEIGLGIGPPLIALLSLGCFLLWRLWGRQKQGRDLPVDFEEHVGDRNGTGSAKELQSTEIFEADGKERKPELHSTELL